jgi:hypothetical protein
MNAGTIFLFETLLTPDNHSQPCFREKCFLTVLLGHHHPLPPPGDRTQIGEGRFSCAGHTSFCEVIFAKDSQHGPKNPPVTTYSIFEKF